MIAFSCSVCRKKFSVKDEQAGTKGKCPGCGQLIAIPAQVVSAAEMPTVPPLAPQASGPDQRRQPAQYEPSEAPTQPPLPDVDATSDNTPKAGPEASLTDFLAPPQGQGELGRLGPYRVLEMLGAGGMGVVFKAEDPDLQRLVALKVMRPELAANAAHRQRFLREARAAAAVKHDHVVTIHHVGEHRGGPYLAMEFLEGQPLDVRLTQQARLPLGQVLRIGRETAQGLAAAHLRGLIHRDIKPANIWLEAPGDRVKVLDFGLARAADDDAHLTQQGAIVGTPGYMAPEQARGESVTARSDLFSLGVMLYRLCSGQEPFKAPDAVSMLIAVALDAPVPLRTLQPELPLELSDLVMQLLEKEPDRRPASAAVVVEALRKLETQRARRTADRQDTALYCPEPQRAGAAPRSRRLLAVFLAALLLAGLIALGVWTLNRLRTDQDDYVIATDDPDFSFRVSQGAVTLQDDRTKHTYPLTVLRQDKAKGEWELEVTDPGAELSFKTKTFTIRRGQQVAVKEWFERTPAAAVQGPEPLQPAVVPKKPALILMVGAAKAPVQGRRGSLAYVWDGKADRPTPYKALSNLDGRLEAVAVARNNQEYCVEANSTTVVQANKEGKAILYRHTTYVRDLALDDDDDVYFSEASGGGADGKIYCVHPPQGGAGVSVTPFCSARLQDLGGSWSGNFAFGRTPTGGLDTGTLYLSSAGGAGAAGPAGCCIYRLKRQGDTWSKGEFVFRTDTPIEGLMFTDAREAYYLSGNRVFRLTDLKKAEAVLTLPEVTSVSHIAVLPQATDGKVKR